MIDYNGIQIPDEYMDVSFFSLPQMKNFSSIEKDSAGNYHFIQSGKGEKIQIIFRINPSGVLVGKEEEGKCAVSVLGNEKKLTESILYRDLEPLGVLRKENERFYIEKITQNDDLFMEILTPKKESVCKDGSLYSNDISSVISLKFADFFINEASCTDKCIDFTVWNSSLAGENGLLSAVKTANADKVLFVSLADKKDFTDDTVPAIVFKDGNYVMTDKQRELVTSLNEESLFFVGKTNRAMEQLDVHFFDKKLLGVYLPVSHFGNHIEKISLSVLKKTQDLLLKCITVL